ncbi:MAG: CAP domain-containing protein [Calditrichaeota bacterium]|nr:MAG: CAP domain-containing protein [Calditrichota bacterium]
MTKVTIIFLLIFVVNLQGQSNSISEIEKAIFRFTNKERTERGLKSLKFNQELQELAKIHNKNMNDYDFFDHEDQNGMKIGERRKAFFPEILGGIGENIAFNKGYEIEGTAKRLVKQWMNSPGHRENILRKEFTQLGVGILVEGNKIYGTQVFGSLVAKILTPIPQKLDFGAEKEFTFEFLGDFEKKDITIFVNFPDENAKFYVSKTQYYTGVGSYKAEWNGNNFKFKVRFDKGKGIYKIQIGSKGEVFQEGIEILVE